MATLTGLFTLGRDAETRVTGSGTTVVQLAVAYNYGRKGAHFIHQVPCAPFVGGPGDWLLNVALTHLPVLKSGVGWLVGDALQRYLTGVGNLLSAGGAGFQLVAGVLGAAGRHLACAGLLPLG